MKHIATRAITIAVTLAALASPAWAGPRSHHRRVAVPASTSAARPSGFYPNEIEGGVSGNLPFNNQVRKLSDPLNANGGR